MDVTLQIMLDPATHDLSSRPEKEVARYRKGDIVAAYFTSDVGSPNLTGRLGFVHITGVPDGGDPVARLEKIQSILGNVISETELVPDPDLPEMVEVKDLIRSRAWRIPPSILPAAKLANLLANREITVTWTQAKPFVRKKLVSIRLDPTSDDETTELTDGDIT